LNQLIREKLFYYTIPVLIQTAVRCKPSRLAEGDQARQGGAALEAKDGRGIDLFWSIGTYSLTPAFSSMAELPKYANLIKYA